MRLDKFLVEMNIGSRSEVKQLLKRNTVQVNGAIIKKPETPIDIEKDIITFQNQTLQYEKYVYYMLHKPLGVVSATEDNLDKTVVSLLEAENRNNLFPVGRLDKDTEGLLILTNDGAFAHNMLSPKKHVAKTYFVILDKPITKEEIQSFQEGLDIKDEKKTLPAILREATNLEITTELLSASFKTDTGSRSENVDFTHAAYITITEGRFHQVKRMFATFHQTVLYLKRVSMGNLYLDNNLQPGQYKKLTLDELKKCGNGKESIC